ncbi:uncharacterized protein LOC111269408 isoform X2 [Varroa jacobsoni]|uniref:uncharacterized protein LOC111269408 isoform X2 n=1 Tax=Varroa jacobsoni TaxID=62625 RepID=UPI000BF8F400|nr:uncharacterized protein LOC111269408 isoform X2 [Varroa jacobsoni]
MSNFSERILELLREHDFPGAEKFDETDIEMMATNRHVRDFFVKIASMDPQLFLNKDQARILQLAGEMNDPSFVPLEPGAVRKQMCLIESKRRRDKILQMRLRHKHEEKRQLEEAIAVLEADERFRTEHRIKREAEMELEELLRRAADDKLNKAHERVQNAITMFMTKGQSHLKKLTNIVEKLKESNGLRNIINQEKYVTLANDIVDACETLHKIVNRPDPDPERYAVPLGENKGVYLLKTLRDASAQLDGQCNDILSVMRQLGGSSLLFGRFEKALTSYRELIQDSIKIFINELFQSTSAASKRQLQQLEPLMTSLEAVIWAQRCIISEETVFLQKCHESFESGDEWARSIMLALPGIEGGIKNTTATNRRPANVTQMGDGSCLHPLSQSAILSSTVLETSVNGTVKSFCTSMSSAGPSNADNGAQLWRTPQIIVQIEDTLSSMTRFCNALHRACEAIQSDRRVLRGCQGVEVISDSAQTQLRSLKADVEKKKSCIMRLLQGRDQLLKDQQDQNEAHQQRILISFSIVNRDSYEKAVEHTKLFK